MSNAFGDLQDALFRARAGQPVDVTNVRASIRAIIDQGDALLRDLNEEDSPESVEDLRNLMLAAEQYDRCADFLERGEQANAEQSWRRAVAVATRGSGGSLEDGPET